MRQPAAKQGDKIVGMDAHVGPNNTTVNLPFNGVLDDNLSPDVNIGGAAAATVGSSATNTPPHIGAIIPPTNKGSVMLGSTSVNINNRPAARAGDKALTCNDPAPAPVGTVVATGSVMIG